MKALKILKTIQNKVVRNQDATKDINALRKEIELIPQDRTNEILDFVRENNIKLSLLALYVFEKIGCNPQPIASFELLQRHGMEPYDKEAVILAVLEEYFKLKENQK